LRPVYANDTAVAILDYLVERDGSVRWEDEVQAQLRRILELTEYTLDSYPAALFTSGRRRYLCRSFRLYVREEHTRPPLVALLLERHADAHAGLLELSRQFHLSPRETETVRHLTHGLTTKEIAQCMKISPNTVKQFIRLTMSKMSVSTRSGILGKALGSNPNPDQLHKRRVDSTFSNRTLPSKPALRRRTNAARASAK
jgi:DNA-binding CsgD family transcriptional regulator